jgi:tetratricopeptide (TPR) repeat protein
MIRRDYLLRMIEQCVQALARSLRLTKEGSFTEARAEIDESLRTLSGLDSDRLAGLSEAELMALLLRGEPTQVLREKCFLMAALLRQAGDVHAAESRAAESRACYLKALNLQLEILLREGPFEFPEYAPGIDVLVKSLEGELLPLATNAGLMQYHESIGQYAKAEDALYRMLETEPSNRAAIEFGVLFYERLRRRTDEELASGNLPRPEVESGLAELKSRGGAL